MRCPNCGEYFRDYEIYCQRGQGTGDTWAWTYCPRCGVRIELCEAGQPFDCCY